MTTKNKVATTTLYASLLVFIAFVLYILYNNKEVFCTAQDRSEFLYGTPFFHTLMLKPFGLMQYVGAWLTQLFFLPVLGAGVLVVFWGLIFFVGVKAFRLHGASKAVMILPVSCLLASVVDLGYWIYFNPIRGYWFSQSVAYLVMLLLVWIARITPRRWHLAWYLGGVCLYPVLGWFALLFVLCLAFVAKPTWRELLGVIVLLFTANIWRALLYSHLSLNDVMLAGLPRFVTASDVTSSLSIPFYLLGFISLVLPVCSRFRPSIFYPLLSAAAGIVYVSSVMINDRSYIDEMRMVRSAEVENWQEVLDIYTENPKPTGSMVMLKNIALMNQGDMLNRSFRLGNEGANIYNPDSIHVSFLEIAAPLVYYNYGMLNEALRLSYECAVQSGFSPFYLKMIARCTNATGEENLKQRFTTLLHHHPYYTNWEPTPASEKIRGLQSAYQDEITGVENSESYIVNSISLWYETDNKVASEQALFFSMLRRDSRRFWPSLRSFIKTHQNEEFPVHAQEAYIMYMDKAPEEKRVMVPVSQEIYDRYKEFWTVLEGHLRAGASREEVPEKMRAEFGDTYWYYNVFARRIY